MRRKICAGICIHLPQLLLEDDDSSEQQHQEITLQVTPISGQHHQPLSFAKHTNVKKITTIMIFCLLYICGGSDRTVSTAGTWPV